MTTELTEDHAFAQWWIKHQLRFIYETTSSALLLRARRQAAEWYRTIRTPQGAAAIAAWNAALECAEWEVIHAGAYWENIQKLKVPEQP